jgi:viroplasmin and RNaseH domain-containing protein
VSNNVVSLDLNAIVKVIEASKKDKQPIKQIVGNFKKGKTQTYDILKSKSGIKRKWLTGQSEHTFQ